MIKKLAIILNFIFIAPINGLPPIANALESDIANALESDDEITCSTDDFHYTILKNSRNQLIL